MQCIKTIIHQYYKQIIMIQLQDVTFAYRRKPKLFKNLNLNLECGKIYGLFGVNGAGKTTLLKQIGGLLKPSEGVITLNGLNVATRDAQVLSYLFLVPEEFELPDVRCSQFVRFNAPFYPNFDLEMYNRCMLEFEMEGDDNLNALSFGQKKKFLISFGLATQTPILLMDEPTNGLDIPSKSQFRKIIAQVATPDRCFVISTHQVRDLATMIDHVVVVDRGNIVFDFSLYDIAQNLSFGHVVGTTDKEVIYSEETLTGHNVVYKGNQQESKVDLETLFNAVIKDSELVNDAIKNR